MKLKTYRVYTCENGAEECYGNEWKMEIDDAGKMVRGSGADQHCPDCGVEGMAHEKVRE